MKRAEVNSQVLQDVLKRVDRAFDGFFRRVKQGRQPGYPRFRSSLRYNSLTAKQYQNSFDIHAGKKQEGTLILSKLGHIKMVMLLPPTGIRHPGHGEMDARLDKWFVSISVESEPEALPPLDAQVGIVGGAKTSSGKRWPPLNSRDQPPNAFARGSVCLIKSAARSKGKSPVLISK